MFFFNNISGTGVVVYSGSNVEFHEIVDTNEYKISVNKRAYKVSEEVYNDVKNRYEK